MSRFSTGEDAGELRADLAKFVRDNPARLLGGTPVRDWILWDSGLTPAKYATRMEGGAAWGGAIEMAIFNLIAGRRVHVCVTLG